MKQKLNVVLRSIRSWWGEAQDFLRKWSFFLLIIGNVCVAIGIIFFMSRLQKLPMMVPTTPVPSVSLTPQPELTNGGPCAT